IPLISDCIIRSNSVSVQGSVDGDSGTLTMVAGGGGINTDTRLVLDNCIIQNNSVNASVSAAIASAIAKGGGIYSTAPLTMMNCGIYSNSVSAQATTGLNETAHAVAEGGGLFASNLTLVNCAVRGNSAI